VPGDGAIVGLVRLLAGAFAAVLTAAFFAAAGAGDPAAGSGIAAVARGARVPAATVFERLEVLAAAASGAGVSAGTQGFLPVLGVVPHGTV
jgi:hypothetical protein